MRACSYFWNSNLLLVVRKRHHFLTGRNWARVSNLCKNVLYCFINSTSTPRTQFVWDNSCYFLHCPHGHCTLVFMHMFKCLATAFFFKKGENNAVAFFPIKRKNVLLNIAAYIVQTNRKLRNTCFTNIRFELARKWMKKKGSLLEKKKYNICCLKIENLHLRQALFFGHFFVPIIFRDN